jgi:hypothetical protein
LGSAHSIKLKIIFYRRFNDFIALCRHVPANERALKWIRESQWPITSAGALSRKD